MGWKVYIVRQGRRKTFLQINQPDDIGILGVGPRNQFSSCPSQVRQQGIRTVEAKWRPGSFPTTAGEIEAFC